MNKKLNNEQNENNEQMKKEKMISKTAIHVKHEFSFKNPMCN